jgi:poly(3-hydroxyoctanoate) depolymerase
MPAELSCAAASRADGADTATRTLAVGCHSLYVAERPGGSPPLLLCNGLGANLELLLPLMGSLDGVATIAFDVPGSGSSPPSPEPMRMRDVAELVARLAARLGHREIDVLGVSWGGMLAQQLAAQYPARIRRLVLVSTGTGSLSIPGDLGALVHLSNPRRWHDMHHLERIAPRIYGGVFRREPARVKEIFGRGKQPSFLGYYGQLMAVAGWSSRAWLHRLRQPTLIISGTDDPLVPVINARVLAERIPNARLRLFDDGHMLLLTRLDEIAPLVREFLQAANP